MSQPPVSLITSGAYIDEELAAEFGGLPPALLPVGSQRLYELQVASLGVVGGTIYMTLPASLKIDDWDAARLDALGVFRLASPDSLSLGGALLNALALIGFQDRPIRILHGDTYIENLDVLAEDVVSTARSDDGYGWADVEQTEAGVFVRSSSPSECSEGDASLSGYFAFSSSSDLARALAISGGNFIEAINIYNGFRPLKTMSKGRWLDFGHVQTYFRSRRIVSTARAFNQLDITDMTVRKQSQRPEKIRAEAAWLAKVPASLRPYCVRLIDESDTESGYSYTVDYEYLPTLSELYVFGRLNRASWLNVLSSCKDFLDTAADAPVPEDVSQALRQLSVDKTRHRLDLFSRETGFDLDQPMRLGHRHCPTVRYCVDILEEIILQAPIKPAVMHGDFCFSNILYGSRMRRVRLIDPRGYFEDGRPSLYGDAHYDVAKLMHSIIGRYDMIIAGRYAGSERLAYDLDLAYPADTQKLWLERTAAEMTLGGVAAGSNAILAVVATLFLSMLPLHSDRPKRQVAFLATALHIFLRLETGTSL